MIQQMLLDQVHTQKNRLWVDGWLGGGPTHYVVTPNLCLSCASLGKEVVNMLYGKHVTPVNYNITIMNYNKTLMNQDL